MPWPTNTPMSLKLEFVVLATQPGIAFSDLCERFDVSRKTFRSEIYADYKANRAESPTDFRGQVSLVQEVLGALHVPVITAEGYEADDVIATLAREARERGLDVMVVTGDRDTFQLIEDGVRVMATGRGITDTTIYDRDAVVDRYGIPPELIPDFYGLKGDTSDNIPGVPGIGDKTASELLQRFGSLERVLDSIDEISGAKRKENLRGHADDARLSKRLATAVTDVAVAASVTLTTIWPPGTTEESAALTSMERPAAPRIALSSSARLTAIHGLARGDQASLAPRRSSSS